MLVWDYYLENRPQAFCSDAGIHGWVSYFHVQTPKPKTKNHCFMIQVLPNSILCFVKTSLKFLCQKPSFWMLE